jgi:hypothetical protein
MRSPRLHPRGAHRIRTLIQTIAAYRAFLRPPLASTRRQFVLSEALEEIGRTPSKKAISEARLSASADGGIPNRIIPKSDIATSAGTDSNSSLSMSESGNATRVTVQDETAKRAKMLFAELDKAGIKSERLLRDALESGATRPEDFARAFENAGLKPEVAKAAGRAVEAHFRLVRIDEGIAKGNREGAATAKNDIRPKPRSKFVSPRAIEWLLIGCLVLTLLVAPWRFVVKTSDHRQQLIVPAPYGLIFWQPAYKPAWGFAEIDVTRYFVQVFAVAAICGVVYIKTRRRDTGGC